MHPSNYSYVTGMYLYGVLVNSDFPICLQVFRGSSVKIPLKDSSLKGTGITIVDRHALEPFPLFNRPSLLENVFRQVFIRTGERQW